MRRNEYGSVGNEGCRRRHPFFAVTCNKVGAETYNKQSIFFKKERLIPGAIDHLSGSCRCKSKKISAQMPYMHRGAISPSAVHFTDFATDKLDELERIVEKTGP
ncbi:hypothetical protein EDM59_29625 [Brevibacillus nitrificans]|uniref:Uncharacterized protein n=1 Tax=Brevibacillus nitrificans TaxID=651560 RepID=A0A3M8CSG7_9BACL|nr:hypothetical protein [Brevibacillus nitrificans]RNB78479.1 hypothetical protein EDM59_29625 [Brevibacillus nitrificans]